MNHDDPLFRAETRLDGHAGPAPESGSVPEVLGPYRIRRELARGGMGVVYVAQDTRLERDVALKVLPDGLVEHPEFHSRFEREAKLLASLNHANIATIHSLEEVEGVRFITMELIPGDSLEHSLGHGPLSLERTLVVGLQTARGLEAAHKRGVVHGDLKPANLQLTPDGDVKILDFGLAFAIEAAGGAGEESRGVTGTPGYMAPEQLQGGSVDARADLFALGCILFECLAGESANRRASVGESIAATLGEGPDLDRLPDDTPAEVRALVERCLSKDPIDRPATAGAVCRVLHANIFDKERNVRAVQDSFSRSPERTLSVGDLAPDFDLESSAGERVRSAVLRRAGPVVVCFHRGVW